VRQRHQQEPRKQQRVKLTLGLKAHSGWAVAVVLGEAGNQFELIHRCRLELVDERNLVWAKQPYHAADGLKPDRARAVVQRGIESAHQVASRELKSLSEDLREQGHAIAGCGVLVAAPLPGWSTEEILAVHVRMHRAEGVLFPDALVRAASACGLRVTAIQEKELEEQVKRTLSSSMDDVLVRVNKIGKAAGPPWRKDHKLASIAAMIAFHSH
jgi:hypothetical protein